MLKGLFAMNGVKRISAVTLALLIQAEQGHPQTIEPPSGITIRTTPSLLNGSPPPTAITADAIVGDCPKPQVSKLANVSLTYDPNDPTKNSVTIPMFSEKDSDCSSCTYQVIL